jgi:aminoglycoside phosphotransferase (APT) family kinase protein
MPDTTRQQAPPAWVTETMGPVSEAHRIRWGFTNESWLVTTRRRRKLVVTRMADSAAAHEVVQRGPAIHAALAGIGISTPVALAESSAPERAIVVSPFVSGQSGMERIGDAQGAASLGRLVGRAWLALGRVETAGLDLDDLWARPNDLAAAARSWLVAAGRAVERPVGRQVSRRLQELPRLLAGRPPGFIHGDLVPANVLVDDEELSALLDLETVRLGERLLDAAWFRWIVRYHHPDVERAAWRGFASASGIDDADSTTRRLLDSLPIVRILEILGQPSLGAAARERWLDQLRACAAPSANRPAG